MGRSAGWVGATGLMMVGLLGGTVLTLILPERAIAVPGNSVAKEDMGEVDRIFSEGFRLFQEGSKKSLVRAISEFEKLLSLSQESLRKDKQALSLLYLGRIHADLGEHQKALNFYSQALEIYRAANDQRAIAVVMNNIGRIYLESGEQQNALKFLRHSLALSRALDDKAGEATTLNNIGLAHFELGDKQKALDIYSQALLLLRNIPDQRGEALTLNNIALTYDALGEKQKALAFFEQALILHRGVKNQNGEATTLTNIGQAYFKLREIQKALIYYEQALSLFQSTGNRYKEASTLNSIGLTYNFLGQNQRAIQVYDRALSLRRAIGDREGQAFTLNNIGGIFNTVKDYQQALSFFSQALKLFENLENRDGIATASNNLGSVYNNLKIRQKSLEFYHRALLLRHTINDREGEAATLYNIAIWLQEQKRPEEAIAFYKQSVIIYEFLRSQIDTLPRSTQERYTSSISDTYRRLSDLLIQQNRLSEAQQVVELLRLREIKEVNPNKSNLQTPVRQMPIFDAEKQSIAQIAPEVAKEIIPTALPQPDRLSPSNPLNRSAQALLTAQPNAALIYQLFTKDKLWLILITPDGKLQRFASTANQAKIELIVTNFRTQIERCEKQNYTCDQTDTQNLNKISQELHQQLFPPDLQAALKQAQPKHLIFALDGSLRNIPMAALHDGKAYLAQQYTLSSIIAAQLTDTQDKIPANTRQSPVLAVGVSQAAAITVPDYINQRGQDRYDALKNVPDELNAIVPPNNSTTKSASSFPGKQLLDSDFNLANLQKYLPQHNILHIASHGIFRPNSLDYSYILMGNNQRWSIAQMDNPDGPSPDGIAQDKTKTKLFQNIHMVSISTCQSGLGGRDTNGIEIAGMSHAFLSQGAKTVTASLWQVNDGSTRVLMNHFYQNLAQKPNQSKAQSLRAAQLYLLQIPQTTLGPERSRWTAIIDKPPISPPPSLKTVDYTHPYYWASFTLIGNSL
jgi:CHAT domain-containing protein/Tfp pilus assembly protein PilF